MVHVDGFKPIAVADECLPVILPEVENFKPTGGNTSVLAQVDDWVRVWVDVETGKTVPITEPKPAGDNWHEGRRETDTLDGYACSSWYFLRYLDPHNDQQAWDPELIKHWAPVDYYNGADHAVAHLLYSLNNYEIKEKIVKAGNSKIFKNWKENVPEISEKDFLEALRWVCEDPRNEKK